MTTDDGFTCGADLGVGSGSFSRTKTVSPIFSVRQQEMESNAGNELPRQYGDRSRRDATGSVRSCRPPGHPQAARDSESKERLPRRTRYRCARESRPHHLLAGQHGPSANCWTGVPFFRSGLGASGILGGLQALITEMVQDFKPRRSCSPAIRAIFGLPSSGLKLNCR